MSLAAVLTMATSTYRPAARAGADLLLFTSGKDAAKAIRALAPLARRGDLDDNVQRVLRFKNRF